MEIVLNIFGDGNQAFKIIFIAKRAKFH